MTVPSVPVVYRPMFLPSLSLTVNSAPFRGYYTDKAGEIVLEGLEPGTTVKVREIKTVEGYVLDGTPQDILIKAGESDVPALAVLDRELRALQGLLGHRVPLQDGQGAEGIIVKSERLSVPGVDHHGLRGGVRLIVVRGLDLGHHIGAGEQLGPLAARWAWTGSSAHLL